MDQLVVALEKLIAFTHPWPIAFTLDFGRYLIAAMLLSGIVWLVPRRVAAFRRMRPNLPRPRQSWFEFRHSLVSMTVFGLMGVVIYHGTQLGIFHARLHTHEQGWLSWAATLALMIVAHDAYFYWTHRLMHRPAWFRRMHRTHHRSVAPTKWAAYSFSIPEAIVQACFVPLFLLVVPMSASAIFAWAAHQILRNVAGHSGVELVPRAWLASWWGRWLTTTLHHDMHHQLGRGNYGLYFTWWDRWCGTEHPQYRARLAMLVQVLDEKAPDAETDKELEPRLRGLE